MDKNFKQNLILVVVGVVLFVALLNIGSIFGFIGNIVAVLLPIFAGLMISFVLNVPMRGFEKLYAKLFSKRKFKAKEKLISVLSLVSTLLCVVLVIVLAITMAVPELISSVKSIYEQLQVRIPEIIKTLNSHNIDTTKLTEILKNMNFDQFVSYLTSGAGSLLTSIWSVASTTVSGVSTTIFALVISVYVLLDKKNLSRHTKKLFYSVMKPRHVDRICEVGKLSVETYSKFLSGQTIEAVILGVLIFISFSIFRLPYAALIAFLTGCFAFIPYVGAFASCAIGAFLILLAAPEKVLTCIIVYLVVQFMENQFIYPHVVGSSVGLSALWTLIAAIVGGNLFGVLGIIFFIPLTAVVYTLIKDYANKRLSRKDVKIE